MDRHAVHEARAELENHQQEVELLYEKIADHQAKLADLQAQKETAKAKKAAALGDYALGKITEGQAQASQKRFAEIEAGEREQQEILAVLNDRLSQLGAKTPTLENKVKRVEGSVYGRIADRLVEQVRQRVIDDVTLAYMAAGRRSQHNPIIIGEWLAGLFPRNMVQDRRAMLEGRLQAMVEKEIK